MLLQTLIFLPAISCFFWIVIYTMMANKTRTFTTALALFATAALYFYTDACYESSITSSGALMVSSLLAQVVTPCVIPLAILYLARIAEDRKQRRNGLLWVVLPVALICTEMALIAANGWTRSVEFIESYYEPGFSAAAGTSIERILYICMENVFRGILIVEFVLFFVWCITLCKKRGFKFRYILSFVVGRREINPTHLQIFRVSLLVIVCAVKVFVTRNVFLENAWIAPVFGIIVTAVIFAVGFAGLFSSRESVTLNDMTTLHRSGSLGETEPKIEENEPAVKEALTAEALQTETVEIEEEDEPVLATESRVIPEPEEENGDDEEYYEAPTKERTVFNDEDLKRRFETLMLDEQLFLTQGITLSDIAARLHSNKTYISKLVNTNYNTTFPDYLNTLRIDYAEQYLLHHRNAKQIEIAKACGFPSASAFNNTFKKLTGETPKIWLATKNK